MKRKLTPLRAIRMKCLDCCIGQIGEVRACPAVTCPLHEYRFGHVPDEMPEYDDGKPEPTEEQKQQWQEMGEKLKKAREEKQ